MHQFPSRVAVLRHILSRSRSLALVLAVALLFFLLNALIVQWDNLDLLTFQNAGVLFTVGVYYLLTRTSFYTLILISVLTGLLVALLIARTTVRRTPSSSTAGVISTLGMGTGAVLPGCASCGIGLAASLGLGSTLAALPFKGAEISLLAIVLLSIAISMVVKSMTIHAACKFPRRKR